MREDIGVETVPLSQCLKDPAQSFELSEGVFESRRLMKAHIGVAIIAEAADNVATVSWRWRLGCGDYIQAGVAIRLPNFYGGGATLRVFAGKKMPGWRH